MLAILDVFHTLSGQFYVTRTDQSHQVEIYVAVLLSKALLAFLSEYAARLMQKRYISFPKLKQKEFGK